MQKVIIKYGLLLFVALSLVKALEYSFFSYKISLELYLGLVALGFTLIGSGIAWFIFVHRGESLDTESKQPETEVLAKFSKRELEILRCVAHGYTNKEVAQMLEISPNTIKTHLSNLYAKLGVTNRTQAAAEAKSLNLIN